VGGTARVVGKQYLFYKTRKVFDSDKKIFEKIIKDRFSIIKNEEDEKFLIDRLFYIKSVKDLVINILGVEADYFKNDQSTQQMFEEVIEEELLKKGISKEDL
jgi:hypothetical protein